MLRTSLAALVLPLVVLTACQGNRQDRLAYVERPVEQLYTAAMAQLDSGSNDRAILMFNEVERQHPYSEWARRSTLMSAYASYEDRRFDAAIETAQRYIALHPAGDGAAYAYYIIAISHFEQIVDVGRDQKTTELARDAFQDVIRRFPETDYARDATVKMDMINDHLAGKEMEIGRWYLRRNQHLSAVNRFRNVVVDYDTTSHAAEALHRLVETYLSLGLRQEAVAAGAVLGRNFPDSDWYRDSYRLLTNEGLNPEAEIAPEPNWFQRLIPGGR